MCWRIQGGSELLLRAHVPSYHEFQAWLSARRMAVLIWLAPNIGLSNMILVERQFLECLASCPVSQITIL